MKLKKAKPALNNQCYATVFEEYCYKIMNIRQ